METENSPFPEFAWCVPHAFSDALGLCRFEQGDTFYDSKVGYHVWSEALKHLNHSIQVEEPKASDKTALKEDDADVFSRNWSNPVLLSLIGYKDGKKSRSELLREGSIHFCGGVISRFLIRAKWDLRFQF